MWQLWAALRHMLRLVLQDRETSRWDSSVVCGSKNACVGKAGPCIHTGVSTTLGDCIVVPTGAACLSLDASHM